MNATILAAHKAVLAAQACLESVQHSLIALLEAEKSPNADGCVHPQQERMVVETLAGREEMCNRCGSNIS
jgi:hypothetical protein